MCMVFLFVIPSSRPVLEKSAGQPVDVQMTSVQRKIISLGQLYAQTERYFPVGKCVCVCVPTCVCVHVCMHTYMCVSMVGGWLVCEGVGEVVIHTSPLHVLRIPGEAP